MSLLPEGSGLQTQRSAWLVADLRFRVQSIHLVFPRSSTHRAGMVVHSRMCAGSVCVHGVCAHVCLWLGEHVKHVMWSMNRWVPSSVRTMDAFFGRG